MKAFAQDQVREAQGYAAAGGQALHLINTAILLGMDVPPPFRGAKALAHLFDQDLDRLVATAKRLGIRILLVHRPGELSQHVDLVGGPLRKAMKECQRETSASSPT
ncbi:MAG: hypothetical protein ABFE07_28660 [Armatimonadia bacterium]